MCPNCITIFPTILPCFPCYYSLYIYIYIYNNKENEVKQSKNCRENEETHKYI